MLNQKMNSRDKNVKTHFFINAQRSMNRIILDKAFVAYV